MHYEAAENPMDEADDYQAKLHTDWVVLNLASYDTSALWWGDLPTASKTGWWRGLWKGLNSRRRGDQENASLTILWHGLAYRDPDHGCRYGFL